jgi:hypothetical protein
MAGTFHLLIWQGCAARRSLTFFIGSAEDIIALLRLDFDRVSKQDASFELPLFHQAVAARDHEQRDERDGHAADAGNGHRLHHVRSTTGMEEDRSQAEDCRDGRHQAGANALQAGLDDETPDVIDILRWLLAKEVLQVGQHHDAVVIGDADQSDEADPHGDAQVCSVE